MDLTPNYPEQTVLRRVHDDPGERIATLYASVRMKSDLDLGVERSPDFFRLYDLEHAKEDQFVWTAQRGMEVFGVASFLARDAYLEGRPRRVAYVTDLRVQPGHGASKLIGENYNRLLKQVMYEADVEAAYTVVFDSNRRAVRALVEPSETYVDRPRYLPIRRFTIRSVQFAHRPLPFRRLMRGGALRVRRATSRDLDFIIATLAEDHREREMGYVFEDGLLERRLQTWPDFEVENFFIAEDRTGAPKGFAATWDPQGVKRYRVFGYDGGMRSLKRFYDPAAKLLGGRPLPNAGELMPYFYLTHVCVPSNDPAVLAALVDEIYAAHAGEGYCFFTVYEPEGDPLAPALKGYVTNGLPSTLYEVVPGGASPRVAGRVPETAAGRVGFEMALA